MRKFDDGIMRFFDADTLIRRKFDLSQEPEVWLAASKIAEIIGVPITVGSCTRIGTWARKNELKRGRSSTQRLILMPKPKEQ